MKSVSALFVFTFLFSLRAAFNCFAEENTEDKTCEFNLVSFFLWGGHH